MDFDEIVINTDGSCLGNPGKGGYAALIEYYKDGDVKETKEISGSEEHTTNNKMELMAAIKGLEAVSGSKIGKITVITDSNYVKLGITQWINGWKKNGWRTANRKPVSNDNLWRRLDALSIALNAKWKWVKAHNGDPRNERVDSLARDQARKVGTKSKAPSYENDNNKKIKKI